MKKITLISCLILALSACKKDENKVEYISAPLIPVETLYWGMNIDDAVEAFEKAGFPMYKISYGHWYAKKGRKYWIIYGREYNTLERITCYFHTPYIPGGVIEDREAVIEAFGIDAEGPVVVNIDDIGNCDVVIHLLGFGSFNVGGEQMEPYLWIRYFPSTFFKEEE